MNDWITAYQEFTKTPWQMTTLKPEQENQFRDWLSNTDLFKSIKEDIAQENKIPASALDNNRVLEMVLQSQDYDYRGAFLDNMQSAISTTDNKPHFFSSDKSGRMLKAPTHETAWKEFFMRQFNTDPDELGLDTLQKAQQWTDIQKQQSPTEVMYADPFGFSIK